MNDLYNLNTIAERFCGAILFDGEGHADIVTTNEPFSFDRLHSFGVDDTKIKFNSIQPSVAMLDLANFTLENLPTNVTDVEEVEDLILEQLNKLSPSNRKLILNKLNNLEEL